MARRGRCRCGEILVFRRGPQGYKTRCPSCQAVVRLRAEPSPQLAEVRTVFCSCGTAIQAMGHESVTCPACRRSLDGTEAYRPSSL
jgi:hypothetical protein